MVKEIVETRFPKSKDRMDAHFDEEMNKAKKAPKDEQLDVYKNLCSITVPCKITEKKKASCVFRAQLGAGRCKE